jgi:hypothetical protein
MERVETPSTYNASNGAAFLGVGDGAGNFAFNPLSISPGYNLADIGDSTATARWT